VININFISCVLIGRYFFFSSGIWAEAPLANSIDQGKEAEPVKDLMCQAYSE
jgi:hypothetical protein